MLEQKAIIRDNNGNKEAYRGFAIAQMRILKEYMKIAGLRIATRTVNLIDSVSITCSVNYEREDIFIKVIPIATQSVDLVKFTFVRIRVVRRGLTVTSGLVNEVAYKEYFKQRYTSAIVGAKSQDLNIEKKSDKYTVGTANTYVNGCTQYEIACSGEALVGYSCRSRYLQQSDGQIKTNTLGNEYTWNAYDISLSLVYNGMVYEFDTVHPVWSATAISVKRTNSSGIIVIIYSTQMIVGPEIKNAFWYKTPFLPDSSWKKAISTSVLEPALDLRIKFTESGTKAFALDFHSSCIELFETVFTPTINSSGLYPTVTVTYETTSTLTPQAEEIITGSMTNHPLNYTVTTPKRVCMFDIKGETPIYAYLEGYSEDINSIGPGQNEEHNRFLYKTKITCDDVIMYSESHLTIQENYFVPGWPHFDKRTYITMAAQTAIAVDIRTKEKVFGILTSEEKQTSLWASNGQLTVTYDFTRSIKSTTTSEVSWLGTNSTAHTGSSTSAYLTLEQLLTQLGRTEDWSLPSLTHSVALGIFNGWYLFSFLKSLLVVPEYKGVKQHTFFSFQYGNGVQTVDETSAAPVINYSSVPYLFKQPTSGTSTDSVLYNSNIISKNNFNVFVGISGVSSNE